MLVVGQTALALALVLLIGSALLVQSFDKLRSVDPGYRTEDNYTFQFAPERPFRDGPSWGRLHLAFMDRLRVRPGGNGIVCADIGAREEWPAIGSWRVARRECQEP